MLGLQPRLRSRNSLWDLVNSHNFEQVAAARLAFKNDYFPSPLNETSEESSSGASTPIIMPSVSFVLVIILVYG